jgi:short-subunit dehydrogenase
VESAVEILKQKTKEVLGVVGDISNDQFCEELKDQTLERFGKIDILINNAGVAASGNISKLTYSSFSKVVETNLIGSVNPTLACLPEIMKQKGSILFVSSVAGIVGLPKYSAYSATKRALLSFAESLKIELSENDVFVGINFPGFTENDEKKTTLNSLGEEETLKKREGVRLNSQEKTAQSIIKQIEKRRFISFSSFSGRFTQIMYRFFPALSIFILTKLKRKMDAMQ